MSLGTVVSNCNNHSNVPQCIAISLLVIALLAPPAFSQASSQTIIPIVFPVAGKCSFTDTFGAPRDNGARTHQGIDIMADKMTPVLAVVDGVVDWLNDGTQTSTANGLPYYNLLLHGDDGNDYYYIHLNNDTPGTDDANGGPRYAYAPGIVSGSRVIAGQHIAYVGDSGNAENTAPHLHFEIHEGGYKNPINPYASLVAAQNYKLFKDISYTDWYFPYVNNLVKKGAVSGYGDGTFRPASFVTRAEFIKMVVLASKVETATTYGGLFPDVGDKHWAWPYVEAAKRIGLVDGDSSGNFKPDKLINRAEAAKIVVKALNLSENLSGVPFTDVHQGFWGYAFIMTAKNSGIISGYPDGTYRPLNSVSRAEAAKVVFKASN